MQLSLDLCMTSHVPLLMESTTPTQSTDTKAVHVIAVLSTDTRTGDGMTQGRPGR